jgi:hypothetical protein
MGFLSSSIGRVVAACGFAGLWPFGACFDLNLTAIGAHNSADHAIFPAFFRRSV